MTPAAAGFLSVIGGAAISSLPLLVLGGTFIAGACAYFDFDFCVYRGARIVNEFDHLKKIAENNRYATEHGARKRGIMSHTLDSI